MRNLFYFSIMHTRPHEDTIDYLFLYFIISRPVLAMSYKYIGGTDFKGTFLVVQWWETSHALWPKERRLHQEHTASSILFNKEIIET